MAHPKVGMHYEDVRTRVKRIAKNSPHATNLIDSLKNQARLHEGEGAVKELDTELSFDCGDRPKAGYNPKYSKGWELIFG